tara:strand:- start:1313 stop:1972 length:660 start_codon:yes stop_codon:yes gene_type:complete
MARTINSPITDERGEVVYLYEINHSGGVLRYTNSTADVTALTFTWTAIGGAMIHSGATESSDRRSQGVQLRLFGVDQSITSSIQSNQFRGQVIKIYLLHFDPDTGVQDTPDLIFQGRQNSDFRVKETRNFDNPDSGGTVTVTTRVSADLSSINTKVSVRCNVHSHEEMMRRSGVGAPDDKFFIRVSSIMGKNIYWGSFAPETGGVLGPDINEDTREVIY